MSTYQNPVQTSPTSKIIPVVVPADSNWTPGIDVRGWGYIWCMLSALEAFPEQLVLDTQFSVDDVFWAGSGGQSIQAMSYLDNRHTATPIAFGPGSSNPIKTPFIRFKNQDLQSEVRHFTLYCTN